MADYISRKAIEYVLMKYVKSKSFDNNIVTEIMTEIDRLPRKSTEYISKESIIDKCKEHRGLYITAWGGFADMPKEDKAACDAYATCWADVVNAEAVWITD
jgi:hypothetical protein